MTERHHRQFEGDLLKRGYKSAADDWWQELWAEDSSITDVRMEILPDGWRHWRDFETALELAGKSIFPSDAQALDLDQGRYIGFVRGTARRTRAETMNLYDPAIGARVGVDQ